MMVRGHPYWRWAVPCLALALGVGSILVGLGNEQRRGRLGGGFVLDSGLLAGGGRRRGVRLRRAVLRIGLLVLSQRLLVLTTTAELTERRGRVRRSRAVPDGSGYWLVNAYRSATGFGKASLGSGSGCTSLNGASGRWVGVAASTTGGGYWLAASNGGVMGCGDMAGPFGGTASLSLDAPIVSMAPTPDRLGYWLVGADGGVFAFGDAGYFGSMGGHPLNAPIVGISFDVRRPGLLARRIGRGDLRLRRCGVRGVDGRPFSQRTR